MGDGGKQTNSVWSVALLGGVTAAAVAVALDLAGVESLGRPTAAVVRAVAFGSAVGLVLHLRHRKQQAERGAATDGGGGSAVPGS